MEEMPASRQSCILKKTWQSINSYFQSCNRFEKVFWKNDSICPKLIETFVFSSFLLLPTTSQHSAREMEIVGGERGISAVRFNGGGNEVFCFLALSLTYCETIGWVRVSWCKVYPLPLPVYPARVLGTLAGKECGIILISQEFKGGGCVHRR